MTLKREREIYMYLLAMYNCYKYKIVGPGGGGCVVIINLLPAVPHFIPPQAQHSSVLVSCIDKMQGELLHSRRDLKDLITSSNEVLLNSLVSCQPNLLPQQQSYAAAEAIQQVTHPA